MAIGAAIVSCEGIKYCLPILLLTITLIINFSLTIRDMSTVWKHTLIQWIQSGFMEVSNKTTVLADMVTICWHLLSLYMRHELLLTKLKFYWLAESSIR